MACSSTNSGYLNIRRLLVDFCWAMSFKLTFGVFGYCCNYCCGPGNCCYYCCYYKSDYYCCYCYCKSDYYCCYYCYYYYYYYHCCYYYYYCCSRSLLNSSSGSPNSSSFFSNLIINRLLYSFANLSVWFLSRSLILSMSYSKGLLNISAN